jgi:glutamate---cysteine ligase / carboxylate-amine ligase
MRMAGPDEDFTLGVEEEYLLVNPGTRELVPASPKVLARSQPELGELAVQHELFLAQVELGTPVCRTLGELRTNLTDMRRQLAAGARASGCRIAAAGTHPFSSWKYQQVTPRRRYLEFVADYQQIAREQVLCGCHVHVGIADPEAAIQTMNRVQAWLAPLLALAGNSPFWQGADTGYASYRTQLWRRWPTAESAGTFASRTDYDQLVASLVEVGAIKDATHIWWDVRPSAKYPTIEFRVTDVATTVDEAVMLAGLVRALARTCHAEALVGDPAPIPRPELLRAARWRAARYGLGGELIDVTTQQLVPAPLLVERFLTHLRPALEEPKEWDEVADLVDATMTRGPGAERQRAAYARTGRFEDVVDQVVAETATPWPQVSPLGTNRM